MKTAEEIIKDNNREMVCISPDQTIREAIRLMTASKIGAILVKKEDKIVGIWTERDLLYNSNQPGFDPDTHLIGDYMTTSLHTARHDTSILKIKEMFLGLFIRHLIVEKDGDYIGLLSIGDVIRASLIEQDRQIKELNKVLAGNTMKTGAGIEKRDEPNRDFSHQSHGSRPLFQECMTPTLHLQ